MAKYQSLFEKGIESNRIASSSKVIENNNKVSELDQKFSSLLKQNTSEVKILSDLEEINGSTMIILLNLLNYHATKKSLNAIQESIGMNRSSFYYTIEKLRKKGLIEVNLDISEDQRKKTAFLTSKGYDLLRFVHSLLQEKIY